MATLKGQCKLGNFFSSTFAPIFHIGFTLAWFFALQGTLLMITVKDQYFRLNYISLGAVASVFLMLFFLRVVDEIKDFEYDKIFNKDRPLVTGIVTIKDLKVYLIVTAAIIVVINALISWNVLMIMVFDMAYGLLLIRIEKKINKVKDNMLVNLLFTYPVNIIISIYIYNISLLSYNLSYSSKSLVAIVPFIFAFLFYEISRKTSWIKDKSNGKRLYSNDIGPVKSLILASFCGICAIVMVLKILDSYQPLLKYIVAIAFIPIIFAVYKFIKERNNRKCEKPDKIMVPYAMLYLTIFYLSQIAISICSWLIY